MQPTFTISASTCRSSRNARVAVSTSSAPAASPQEPMPM